MASKVRAGSVYFYDPVPMDRVSPPYGVQTGMLKPGDRVRVVNLPGCPKAGTMGMCHIETEKRAKKDRQGRPVGEFLGLVMVSSLVKEKPATHFQIFDTTDPAKPKAVSAAHPDRARVEQGAGAVGSINPEKRYEVREVPAGV